MACEFSGGFSPRDKNWWVYSFSTVEIAAAQAQGSALIAPLSSIPVRQGERWQHIKEIAIKLTFRMDTATTMAADIDGSEVAGVVSAVSLMDIFGHEYIRGGEADGRAVIDAMGLLKNTRLSSTPALIPDANATDVLRTVVIVIPFHPGPRDQYAGATEWDQIQPLFIFNERSGSAGLRLRLANFLPANPTGVTDNTVTLCEVYVRCIADKDLHCDAPWWMRVSRYTQTSFISLPDAAGADPMHRMLYAFIRHTPQDAVGTNLNDYANLTVKHGVDEWIAGRTAVEVATTMNQFVVEDALARTVNDSGGAAAGQVYLQDTANPTFLPLMETRPGAIHSEWGQAPMTINLTRSASRPDTRVLFYGYSKGKTSQYIEMVAAAVGLAADQIAVASKLKGAPTTPGEASMANARQFASAVIRAKG